MEVKLILGFCVAGSIALAGWKFRALDGSGAIVALAMGTVVFGLGGLVPSVALVLFFISGSILSSLPRGIKMPSGDEALGRSWKQVAANGSIPMAMILLSVTLPSQRVALLIVVVSAIAAAAADSWSTEIGTRYGANARDILSGKPLPAGASGAVSSQGLLAAIAGAALVASSSLFLDASVRLTAFIAITIAGFLGAVADSIMGSSLQAGFVCSTCSSYVETGQHCNSAAELVKGKHWVNNNVVNFAATAIGAFFCAVELDFLL